MPPGRPSAKGEARERILDVSEELFALHGVDGVSLRTINAAAGVSPGVLHYHFGSREVLVFELLSRHMDSLWQQRRTQLDRLLEQDKPSLADIMRTLAAPLAELVLQPSEDGVISPGARYVRFMARLYADRSELLQEISQRYVDTVRLYPLLLQRALPQVPEAELELRFSMANHAMLLALSDLTWQRRPWQKDGLAQLDPQQLTTILVDFTASGMQGASTNDIQHL